MTSPLLIISSYQWINVTFEIHFRNHVLPRKTVQNLVDKLNREQLRYDCSYVHILEFTSSPSLRFPDFGRSFHSLQLICCLASNA